MIVKTVSIKSVTAPGMGTLSFFEAEKDVPFAVKRIYYIHGVPAGVQRGGHAHRKLRQILWCPYGRIRIKLDDGAETAEVLLDDPAKGLLVEHNTWREMFWEQADSVLCVAADAWYDETDYVRDYRQFKASLGGAQGEV